MDMQKQVLGQSAAGRVLRRVPGACGKNDGAVISYILPEQT